MWVSDDILTSLWLMHIIKVIGMFGHGSISIVIAIQVAIMVVIVVMTQPQLLPTTLLHPHVCRVGPHMVCQASIHCKVSIAVWHITWDVTWLEFCCTWHDCNKVSCLPKQYHANVNDALKMSKSPHIALSPQLHKYVSLPCSLSPTMPPKFLATTAHMTTHAGNKDAHPGHPDMPAP